jgi:hypothetical protein
MSALPVWEVPSVSRPELRHLVMRLPDGRLTCTCEAARFGRMCRHRVAVLLQEEDPMTVTNITQRTTNDHALGTIETVLATGDLSKLSPEDRTRYLLRVCESLQLNPLTRPLQYIVLSNKLTLYATRDATDQLRKLHGVSVRIVSRERMDDLYIVQAEATDKTGRSDTSLGVVSIRGLAGEALANALMKTETKAKRRVTLSICGLGMLDETEVQSVLAIEQQAPALGAGESGVQADTVSQRPRLSAPQPSAPATGERPDFDAFWRTVREQGFQPADIQSAAVSTWHKQVPHLTREQLAELRDAVLGARLVADAEGVWTIVPIGAATAASAEEGPLVEE